MRVVPRLELRDARERELVRNSPPAELGTAVVESVLVVDRVEAVERALGPRAPHAGHGGDRAVARGPKQLRPRLALLRQQQHVVAGVAHLDAAHEARVREPRAAAERRRRRVGRDDVPAGLGGGVRELVARRRDDARDRRLVVGHGAVRLEEQQQHVVAFELAEIGLRQRQSRQVAARIGRRGREHEPQLAAGTSPRRAARTCGARASRAVAERVERDEHACDRADARGGPPARAARATRHRHTTRARRPTRRAARSPRPRASRRATTARPRPASRPPSAGAGRPSRDSRAGRTEPAP